MSTQDYLESNYGLSKNTVKFLIELFGESAVEDHIKEAIKNIGAKKFKEADLITECLLLKDNVSVQGTEPAIDTSFLDSNDKEAETLNKILGFIIIIMLSTIACTLISVALKINFKYLAGFVIILILLYYGMTNFTLPKRKVRRG